MFLIRAATDLLRSTPARQPTEVFPACDGCPLAPPVPGTSEFGRAFDKIGVEEKDKLWGSVKGWSTHVIIPTGENDWTHDVNDIKGSVMEALSKRRDEVKNGKLMVSASDLPVEGVEDGVDVILLPEWIVVKGVRAKDAGKLVQIVNVSVTTGDKMEAEAAEEELAKQSNGEEHTNGNGEISEKKPEVPEENGHTLEPTSTKLSSTLSKLSLSSTLQTIPLPTSYLILLCSHRRRDARCGISAPILRKEFEKHLRPLGLWRDHTDHRPGGAKVIFINHVGGHKYSANCMIYRKEGGEGMWLARVAPRHVEGIVKHTILEGKLTDESMIRGGFCRRTGATSW